MAYDKSTDYSVLMNQAANQGNYGLAAQYEQQRNEKIAGEKMNYSPTYNYQGYYTSSPQDSFQQYKDSMNSAISAYNQSVDAGLQSAQLDRANTMQTAGQQLTKANRAANAAYAQAVNPYGYNAQALAGMGLANSGISESSRIAAGNSYQNALAANNTAYSEAQRAADLAYNKAAADAAASKASYLASNLENQASTGLSQNQWNSEYVLKKITLDDQLQTNQISRKQYEAELEKIKMENDLYRTNAQKQAEADYQQSLADIAYTQAQTAKLNRS